MQVQFKANAGLNQYLTICGYTALCRATQMDITYVLQKRLQNPCKDVAKIWIATPLGTHSSFQPVLSGFPQV